MPRGIFKICAGITGSGAPLSLRKCLLQRLSVAITPIQLAGFLDCRTRLQRIASHGLPRLGIIDQPVDPLGDHITKELLATIRTDVAFYDLDLLVKLTQRWRKSHLGLIDHIEDEIAGIRMTIRVEALSLSVLQNVENELLIGIRLIGHAERVSRVIRRVL